jgi:oxygen-independent coproporphyrinogen-3 oxidase
MFGVYIHFPYCRKRCPYCDFATHARERIPHDAYADAVVRELAARGPLFAGRQAVSIYFGGGTPGLWRADCVARVLRALRAEFAVAVGAEVTIEANPGELEREQLDALLLAGCNRLSLGVQSLEPRHLVTLGRLHGVSEPVEAVSKARAAGFSNLSLDLMFALPSQTLAELDRDLDRMLALAPDHLSIYNLTVEARTPFGAMQREGTLRLPDTGLQAEMFEQVNARMADAGFAHYEISNYARPGREAVHNSLYWRQGEYLGLGSSAHSHRQVRGPLGLVGERFSTVRSVDDYFARAPRSADPLCEIADDPAVASYERLPPEAVEREAMWLGLRLLAGISRDDHHARHGVDPVVRHEAVIARLREEGLLEGDERLRLTRRGVLFADEVGARFL